jgi:bifunctional UDP-N-acetylglucosamine pyrophosphorylase/glucosamine-1-phosphate N-acetyltransferase
VVGFGAEQVRQAFDDDSISWVEQSEQLGTGHAVQQVMPYINDDSISLVLYGDVPLIRQSTLENLIVQAQKSGVALLSVMLDNPTGYGRIMRKDNQIQAIVEQKDANAEQLTICEVNTGIMALDTSLSFFAMTEAIVLPSFTAIAIISVKCDVSLGNNTTIAPNCIIKNAKIGNNVVILPK